MMSDETPLHSGPLHEGPIDGSTYPDQAMPIASSVAGSSTGNTPPKVVGYCRSCGTALTEATVRVAQGSIFCAEHTPAAPFSPPSGARPQDGPSNYPPRTGFADPRYDSPYTSTAPAAQSSANPVAAFWLGLIPGVGAIYNGQYAKGMSHVVIFGLLISLTDIRGPLEPLFGMLIPAFVFYMAFEAHHTARNRRDGLPVDEFSSLVPGHTAAHDRFPVGPMILIVAGVVFLLDSLEIFQIQRLERFWPVLLILLGAYLLYSRTAGWTGRDADSHRTTSHVYTHSSGPVPEAKPSAKREVAEPAASERV